MFFFFRTMHNLCLKFKEEQHKENLAERIIFRCRLLKLYVIW